MPPGLTVEDSPLDMLLREQSTLQTPVGLFSARHESPAAEPEQARFYKDLIPLSKPAEGEQYAFEVDLDRCTGCKACVSACHSLNGLEEEETWRDIGSIHGIDPAGQAYSQTVTTACHHCIDPGCLNGCPVLAYEKDPETGIVHHLDDQCIGCQYCVLKCPYDVPKYSEDLGIVRKCDLCQSRLADGEAPACVQACPTEAIRVTIINTEAHAETARTGAGFLPGAPEPSYTLPTTRYESRKPLPEAVLPGDHYALKPQHAHFPLVFMLVLMQLSVGLYAATLLAPAAEGRPVLRWLAFAALLFGMASATAHLGRPLGAWRAFLGLRRSWLSREILAFGGFAACGAAYSFGDLFPWFSAPLLQGAGWATLLAGLVGNFCSVMIYADTRRPFWDFPGVLARFAGSLLGLGLAGLIAFSAIPSTGLVVSALTVFSLKLSYDANLLRSASSGKSSALMLGPLQRITLARFVLGLAGMACLVCLLSGKVPPVTGLIGFVCLLAGEFLERTLFFKAVVPLKMPGPVTS